MEIKVTEAVDGVEAVEIVVDVKAAAEDTGTVEDAELVAEIGEAGDVGLVKGIAAEDAEVVVDDIVELERSDEVG